MATAFASWITTHPDDGRFILTNGYDWTYFTVKDAPFFVKRVFSTPAGPVLRAPKTAELIASYIRGQIVRGDLKTGDSLPSETVLNFTLQAPITVVQASPADANRQKLGNTQ